jgi:hypothetical protein
MYTDVQYVVLASVLGDYFHGVCLEFEAAAPRLDMQIR